MHVLIVTGSRHYIEVAEKWVDTVLKGVDLLIIGDASGVDLLIRQRALQLGIKVAAIHAFWKQEGNAAGTYRNQAMIDLGVLIRPLGATVVGAAFPATDSIGTWRAVDAMKAAKIPCTVFRSHAIEEFFYE